MFSRMRVLKFLFLFLFFAGEVRNWVRVLNGVSDYVGN